ncbi:MULTISPECIES: YHS domain-containing protein [Nocardia]|uniref:YHS domain-containing protein n=1 Tax=Nocardia TaxID=1817 RepID=UPI001893F171|nr:MULTISPECIES: YHS domain-containing protein [Nocardia]MBF6476261.1 YHS domain-containing protein [Nocardia abscessus]MDE1673572.1 YHS domain-containing protein [Nocardia gipuzkoensis]
MMTVELFVSDPALTADRKRALAERILRVLTTEPSAPDSVMSKARELTHVLVRDADVWATGGPALDDAPRYLARLTVPGSWANNTEFGGHVIPLITEAVGGTEPDPDRLTRDPHCVVQIIGLRENNLGTFGHTLTATEITKLMTEDYRASGTHTDAPEGHAIDPVCGMTVDLSTARFTLTHNGTHYAFCAPVCRKVFAEDHAVPL